MEPTTIVLIVFLIVLIVLLIGILIFEAARYRRQDNAPFPVLSNRAIAEWGLNGFPARNWAGSKAGNIWKRAGMYALHQIRAKNNKLVI